MKKTGTKTGGVEVITQHFSQIYKIFPHFQKYQSLERMVALMNEYLTVMSKVILDNEGTLDKYIGDAIVAFYGAPVPVKDHEIKSCYTALLQKALES